MVSATPFLLLPQRGKRNRAKGKIAFFQSDKSRDRVLSMREIKACTDGERTKIMEREAMRKRRAFSPVMTALLAVLVLAGCTLTLLVVQFRRNIARQQAQQAKDESVARQLEEIRQYLSAVDETLLNGQLTDADGYDSLFQEVSAMQQNLTDYKENNVIADDAIGQNLDDVIEQLSAIQTNLEEERKVSESLWAGVDSTETTAAATREENRKNAEQLQQTVDVQLSDVREDIRKLIREASGESREEYQELLHVLNGTDSDLDSLEKTIAANHDRIQSAISSGMGSINGSVSNVRTTLTAMQELLNTVSEQNARLQSEWETISANQEAMQNSMAEEQRNLFSSVEERQEQLENLLRSELDELCERILENQRGLQEELLARHAQQQETLEHETYGLAQLEQLLRECGERFDAQEKLLEEQGAILSRIMELQNGGATDGSETGSTDPEEASKEAPKEAESETETETPAPSGSDTEETGETEAGETASSF